MTLPFYDELLEKKPRVCGGVIFSRFMKSHSIVCKSATSTTAPPLHPDTVANNNTSISTVGSSSSGTKRSTIQQQSSPSPRSLPTTISEETTVLQPLSTQQQQHQDHDATNKTRSCMPRHGMANQEGYHELELAKIDFADEVEFSNNDSNQNKSVWEQKILDQRQKLTISTSKSRTKNLEVDKIFEMPIPSEDIVQFDPYVMNDLQTPRKSNLQQNQQQKTLDSRLLQAGHTNGLSKSFSGLSETPTEIEQSTMTSPATYLLDEADDLEERDDVDAIWSKLYGGSILDTGGVIGHSNSQGKNKYEIEERDNNAEIDVLQRQRDSYKLEADALRKEMDFFRKELANAKQLILNHKDIHNVPRAELDSSRSDLEELLGSYHQRIAELDDILGSYHQRISEIEHSSQSENTSDLSTQLNDKNSWTESSDAWEKIGNMEFALPFSTKQKPKSADAFFAQYADNFFKKDWDFSFPSYENGEDIQFSGRSHALLSRDSDDSGQSIGGKSEDRKKVIRWSPNIYVDLIPTTEREIHEKDNEILPISSDQEMASDRMSKIGIKPNDTSKNISGLAVLLPLGKEKLREDRTKATSVEPEFIRVHKRICGRMKTEEIDECRRPEHAIGANEITINSRDNEQDNAVENNREASTVVSDYMKEEIKDKYQIKPGSTIRQEQNKIIHNEKETNTIVSDKMKGEIKNDKPIQPVLFVQHENSADEEKNDGNEYKKDMEMVQKLLEKYGKRSLPDKKKQSKAAVEEEPPIVEIENIDVVIECMEAKDPDSWFERHANLSQCKDERDPTCTERCSLTLGLSPRSESRSSRLGSNTKGKEFFNASIHTEAFSQVKGKGREDEKQQAKVPITAPGNEQVTQPEKSASYNNDPDSKPSVGKLRTRWENHKW